MIEHFCRNSLRTPAATAASSQLALSVQAVLLPPLQAPLRRPGPNVVGAILALCGWPVSTNSYVTWLIMALFVKQLPYRALFNTFL